MNADDFGLTQGVNRAILELHALGALTSATLMAQAPATDHAIALAINTPSLGVGCHVVLVDGEPILSTLRQRLSLSDPITGRFRPTLLAFLAELYRPASSHRSARLAQAIEAEATAQITKLQKAGLTLTHVDTHKHTHMFPVVLRPLLRAARSAGIRVVRNPFEPAWSRRATADAPPIRRMEVQVLGRLKAAFLRIVAEEGFTTTDGALGVLATGTLNVDVLNSLLSKMPAGTWELVTHPGYSDRDLAQVRTRLRESRERERFALATVPLLREMEMIRFTDLLPQGTFPAQTT